MKWQRKNLEGKEEEGSGERRAWKYHGQGQGLNQETLYGTGGTTLSS